MHTQEHGVDVVVVAGLRRGGDVCAVVARCEEVGAVHLGVAGGEEERRVGSTVPRRVGRAGILFSFPGCTSWIDSKLARLVCYPLMDLWTNMS